MQQDNLLYRESKKCSVRDGLHDNFYNLNRKELYSIQDIPER